MLIEEAAYCGDGPNEELSPNETFSGRTRITTKKNVAIDHGAIVDVCVVLRERPDRFSLYSYTSVQVVLTAECPGL